MSFLRIAAAGPILFGALIAASPLSAQHVAGNQASSSSHASAATSHSAVVSATRWQVWEELIHPENWWDASHTQSGDAMNMFLSPRVGDCLCERIGSTNGWETGRVEYGRVIGVVPMETLRLSGALGPGHEQGQAGTLTVTLADEAGGTRIAWHFVPAAGGGQGVQFLDRFVGWINQRLQDRAG